MCIRDSSSLEPSCRAEQHGRSTPPIPTRWHGSEQEDARAACAGQRKAKQHRGTAASGVCAAGALVQALGL
eukprot:11018845-Alexandrium_andersonii.AAC.1